MLFVYLESEALIQEQNPLIQSAALYMSAQLDTERSQVIAQDWLHQSSTHLLRETAERLLSLPTSNPALAECPMLEKLAYLFNSNFFHRMQSETLTALADRSEVRTYSNGDVITEAGDTCRELLLLIEGGANIHYQTKAEIRVEQLYPGQTRQQNDSHSSYPSRYL
jgi:hypothetical protein